MRAIQSFSSKYAKRFAPCAVLWLLLLTVSAAFADDSKISPDLRPLLSNPSSTVNVIVQYNTPPESCGGLLAGLVCTATNLLGGVVHTVFGLINAVAGTLTAGDVITLSNQSNVSYISLDRTVAATLDYTADGVNAPLAWSAGWDGTGVGIAVIDSGVYSHPDLKSRVVYRKSFIDGGVQFDLVGVNLERAPCGEPARCGGSSIEVRAKSRAGSADCLV